MKSLIFCALVLICMFAKGQIINTKPSLVKDSIFSLLDGTPQIFYYSKSIITKAQPLVIQLHSWSYPADSLKTIGLDIEAQSKNYNYIFPNFRGVNNHIKACCSQFVLSDIDEAIDWAIKNMNVDKKQIYLIGYSGGGYATLAMYMKSRHKIRAFSAWVPISNIVAWYGESLNRKNKYSSEILKCLGTAETLDTAKAKERSPLFWNTPIKKRKKSTLQIFAGIHDGHGYNMPVPISQSVIFYNKILTDMGEKDPAKYASNEDLKIMLNTQFFPQNTTKSYIGDKVIHYRKQSKNTMLTIFEGGHDLLSKQALEYIEMLQ